MVDTGFWECAGKHVCLFAARGTLWVQHGTATLMCTQPVTSVGPKPVLARMSEVSLPLAHSWLI